MEDEHVQPEQRLFDVASGWYPEPGAREPKRLIEAAVQCLVDGLDSPSLRILAGASSLDEPATIKELLEASLTELGIPRPDPSAPWKAVVHQGRVLSRRAADRVRFAVQLADDSVGGHEVLIFVNDVDVTRAGAGMGMEPFDLLIPRNRLVATKDPVRVPIARCDCGVYGCGSTDVTILRDGDVVHWEWAVEKPMGQGVTFAADEYDVEVARVAADRRWERPEDTSARLVLEDSDRTHLASHGLKLDWVAKDYRNPRLLLVALSTGNNDYRSAEAGYQIFVRFGRADRTPEAVAAEAVDHLGLVPSTWQASWRATKPGVEVPPAMAGADWTWERFP
ncbi:hypothetical protein [Kineosporia sp. A_224]|uniref:hypothetical protein n=1 Tax=Kineosporia sp. A_224 TaxID=1962180 RepID=UPI000B4B7C18|nr:hypothetical protein [Kineosporia sp. A_224]